MPFLDTRALAANEPLPGWRGRFFASASTTFGHCDVSAGAEIHEHAHPNEELWHVIDGELEVTTAGEVAAAGPGFVAIVPPNTLHSVRALSAGRAIVVDFPRRASIGGAKL